MMQDLVWLAPVVLGLILLVGWALSFYISRYGQGAARAQYVDEYWAWRRSHLAALRSLSGFYRHVRTADPDDPDASVDLIKEHRADIDASSLAIRQGRRLLALDVSWDQQLSSMQAEVQTRLSGLTMYRSELLRPFTEQLRSLIPSVADRVNELRSETSLVFTVSLTFLGLVWSLAYYAPLGIRVMPLLEDISDFVLIGFAAGIVPLVVIMTLSALLIWRVMRQRNAALRPTASADVIAKALRFGSRISERGFWIKRCVVALVTFVVGTVVWALCVDRVLPSYWVTVRGKDVPGAVSVVGSIGNYMVLRERSADLKDEVAITIVPRDRVDCIRTSQKATIECAESEADKPPTPPPPPTSVPLSGGLRLAFPLFVRGSDELDKNALVGVPEKLAKAILDCADEKGPILEIRGFADSACFTRDCDGTNAASNVRLANRRAGTLRKAIEDLRLPYIESPASDGASKSPKSVVLHTRKWDETEEGLREMTQAASYADRNKDGKYLEGAGQLNRRAELVLVNAGSCTGS